MGIIGRIYYDFRKSRPIMVSYGTYFANPSPSVSLLWDTFEIWCHRTFEIGHYFSNRFFNANKQMIFVIRFLIRLNEVPIFSDTCDLLLFQDSLPYRAQQVHSLIVLSLDLLIQ